MFSALALRLGLAMTLAAPCETPTHIPQFRKSVVSIKFLPAILGPEMAAVCVQQ